MDVGPMRLSCRQRGSLLSRFSLVVGAAFILCACMPAKMVTLQAPGARWELADPTDSRDRVPKTPLQLVANVSPEGATVEEIEFVGTDADFQQRLTLACKTNVFSAPCLDGGGTGAVVDRIQTLIQRWSQLPATGDCELSDWSGVLPEPFGTIQRGENEALVSRMAPELVMFQWLQKSKALCSERWRQRAARVLAEAVFYPQLRQSRSPALSWLRRSRYSEADLSDRAGQWAHPSYTLSVSELAMLDGAATFANPSDLVNYRDISVRPGSLLRVTITAPLADADWRKPHWLAAPVTMDIPIRFLPDTADAMDANAQWLALNFVGATFASHALLKESCSESESCGLGATFPEEPLVRAQGNSGDIPDSAREFAPSSTAPNQVANIVGRAAVVRRLWNALLDDSVGDLAVNVATALGRPFQEAPYIPETQLEANVFTALDQALAGEAAGKDIRNKAALFGGSRLPNGRIGLMVVPGIVGQPGNIIHNSGKVGSCDKSGVGGAANASCAGTADRLLGLAEAKRANPMTLEPSDYGVFPPFGPRVVNSPIPPGDAEGARNSGNATTLQTRSVRNQPSSGEVPKKAGYRKAQGPGQRIPADDLNKRIDDLNKRIDDLTGTIKQLDTPGGADLQVRLQTDALAWGNPEAMSQWSLAEWQASGVLGFVVPKVHSLTWNLKCTADSSQSTKVTTQVLWPSDTRVPALRLVLKQVGTNTAHPHPVLVPRETDSNEAADCTALLSRLKHARKPLTISYQDLRKLDAVAGLCFRAEGCGKSVPAASDIARLVAVPVAASYSSTGQRPKKFDISVTRTSCVTPSWTVTNGFSIAVDSTCKGAEARTVATGQFLSSLARYAESVYGWELFGAPSPDSQQEINVIDIRGFGEVQLRKFESMTGPIADVKESSGECIIPTHVVELAADKWRGAIRIVPNAIAVAAAKQPNSKPSVCKQITLDTRALWFLTARHVDAVYGLSKLPLRTTGAQP